MRQSADVGLDRGDRCAMAARPVRPEAKVLPPRAVPPEAAEARRAPPPHGGHLSGRQGGRRGGAGGAGLELPARTPRNQKALCVFRARPLSLHSDCGAPDDSRLTIALVMTADSTERTKILFIFAHAPCADCRTSLVRRGRSLVDRETSTQSTECHNAQSECHNAHRLCARRTRRCAALRAR